MAEHVHTPTPPSAPVINVALTEPDPDKALAAIESGLLVLEQQLVDLLEAEAQGRADHPMEPTLDRIGVLLMVASSLAPNTPAGIAAQARIADAYEPDYREGVLALRTVLRRVAAIQVGVRS